MSLMSSDKAGTQPLLIKFLSAYLQTETTISVPEGTIEESDSNLCTNDLTSSN
jgi:hypothetical protein